MVSIKPFSDQFSSVTLRARGLIGGRDCRYLQSIGCLADFAGFGNGDQVRAIRLIYQKIDEELPEEDKEEGGGGGGD
jgi:hypothetical protein